MPDSMLDLWADIVEDRRMVEDFLDWLVEAGHEPPRFHSGREAALDAFFGIDRRLLDKERRDLLAQAAPPAPPAAESAPPTSPPHPSR